MLQEECPTEDDCRNFMSGQSFEVNYTSPLGVGDSATQTLTGQQGNELTIGAPGATATLWDSHFIGNPRKGMSNLWQKVIGGEYSWSDYDY